MIVCDSCIEEPATKSNARSAKARCAARSGLVFLSAIFDREIGTEGSRKLVLTDNVPGDFGTHSENYQMLTEADRRGLCISISVRLSACRSLFFDPQTITCVEVVVVASVPPDPYRASNNSRLPPDSKDFLMRLGWA